MRIDECLNSMVLSRSSVRSFVASQKGAFLGSPCRSRRPRCSPRVRAANRLNIQAVN